MKTTLEISDLLYGQANDCAKSRGVSFRQLVEEGLRAAIREYPSTRPKFRLRDGSFGGKGLVRGLTQRKVRKMIYAGRGE